MVHDERMPLSEACRLVGGVYMQLWRGVTAGRIPATKQHGMWWVRVYDVAVFADERRSETAGARELVA